MILIFFLALCTYKSISQIEDDDGFNLDFDVESALEELPVLTTAIANKSMPFLISLSVSSVDTSDIAVTWSTMELVSDGVVQYSVDANLSNHQTIACQVKPRYKLFDLRNKTSKEYQSQYFYYAVMRQLKCDQTYFYRVGSRQQWSEIIPIALQPCIGSEEEFSVLALADIGANLGGQAVIAMMRREHERQTKPALMIGTH
jgi:hypothetical protein